jgi:hypothetical protein
MMEERVRTGIVARNAEGLAPGALSEQREASKRQVVLVHDSTAVASKAHVEQYPYEWKPCTRMPRLCPGAVGADKLRLSLLGT